MLSGTLRHTRHRLAVFAVLVALLAGPAFAAAQDARPAASPEASPAASPVATADECLVGRQTDGSILLPTNQLITPSGEQVEFEGRPVAVALHPDGETAAFLTNERAEPIVVVNTATGEVLQFFDPGAEPGEAGSSFAGIVYAPDGSRLYASDASGGAVFVTDVAADGSLTAAGRIALAAEGEPTPRPGAIALGPDGQTLYVTLNLRNSLGVVDLATMTLTAEIPVGNAPFGVVLAGGKAYVSNEGGRPAEPGDFTNQSNTSEIVADPVTGGSATGTVSVVDLTAGTEVATIPVGLHPTALTLDPLDGTTLFVANSNSDTISVIDTALDTVIKTIPVQVFPGAPFGSSPNAIARVGDRLVVSLGRNNALAIFEWEGPAEVVSFQGLIPTGWYPADLAVDTTGARLLVAHAKGVGSLGPETEGGPEETNPTAAWVHSNLGSAALLPFAEFEDVETLGADTARVYANNQWSTPICGAIDQTVVTSPAGEAATMLQAVPQRIGDPSPIKHVFYIIKENRTYDQVFGDLPQANGDPSLVQFGREVTPNQHALAEQFQIMDNLYVSGSLSADGHQWVTQAFVTDYIEKAFGDFARAYPFNGRDSLAYSPTGFLWDNAIRNGQSVRAYGEYANQFTGEEDPFGDGFGEWTDWYTDCLILRGEVGGALHVAPGTFQTRTDVPSLDAVLNRDYPPYSMQIPDIYRAEMFLEEFAAMEAGGAVPNLTFMLLPTDHTAGTAPGMPTPDAMVADNDLALGRIIDAITHSSIWAESAIFVIEDDAQNGVDHVDGHRTTGFVVSPYAKRGIVSSQYYTQIDFVRTIEQILGLPPMNQMDLAATPMWDLFTSTPDLTPYDALDNQVPLDTMNPETSSLTGIERAWAETSSGMGFATQADIAEGPDAKDENILNHAIWYGTRGFDVPYPGETRVLWPHEVTPAEETEEDELEEAAERGVEDDAQPTAVPTPAT